MKTCPISYENARRTGVRNLSNVIYKKFHSQCNSFKDKLILSYNFTYGK